MSEHIDCAAILFRPTGKVYSIPRPGRHHNVFQVMREDGIEETHDNIQVFLTNTGRFVNRKEAVRLAEMAKQIIQKTGPAYMLFSEDVW